MANNLALDAKLACVFYLAISTAVAGGEIASLFLGAKRAGFNQLLESCNGIGGLKLNYLDFCNISRNSAADKDDSAVYLSHAEAEIC